MGVSEGVNILSLRHPHTSIHTYRDKDVNVDAVIGEFTKPNHPLVFLEFIA